LDFRRLEEFLKGLAAGKHCPNSGMIGRCFAVCAISLVADLLKSSKKMPGMNRALHDGGGFMR